MENSDTKDNKFTDLLDSFNSDCGSQIKTEEDKTKIIYPLVSIKKEEVLLFEENTIKNEQDVKFSPKVEGFFSIYTQENTTGDDSKLDEKDNKSIITKSDSVFKGDLKGLLKIDEVLENSNETADELNYHKTPVKQVKKKYVKPPKFICKYCNKGFPQTDILRRHLRIHTGEKPHKCSFCGMVFRTKTLLNFHSQSHTGYRYHCKQCKIGIKQLSKLKQHMLIHEGIKPFECAHCHTRLSQKSGLIRHIQRMHSKQNHYQITDLDKSANILRETENQFTCADCGKSFASKYYLTIHVNNHLGMKSNKKFSCKYCNNSYFNSSLCKKHEKRHEKFHENKFEYCCSICSMSYNQKAALNNHMKCKHSELKPVICELCNARFKSTTNLKSHTEVHHNNDKTSKFFCSICNMGFYRLVYLKRHSLIHTDLDLDKTKMCHICDYKCRTKTDMERHVLTHFGGVSRNFKCDKCKKTFIKASHLTRHQLVHSNKKPYKCKLCDNAYKDTSSLKTHLVSHTGKTFTCNDCKFHSINEHSFKRHMRQCQKQK